MVSGRLWSHGSGRVWSGRSLRGLHEHMLQIRHYRRVCEDWRGLHRCGHVSIDGKMHLTDQKWRLGLASRLRSAGQTKMAPTVRVFRRLGSSTARPVIFPVLSSLATSSAHRWAILPVDYQKTPVCCFECLPSELVILHGWPPCACEISLHNLHAMLGICIRRTPCYLLRCSGSYSLRCPVRLGPDTQLELGP